MSQCQWLRVPALSQPGVGWEPPNSRTVVRLGQFKDVKRSAAFAEGVPGCSRMFHWHLARKSKRLRTKQLEAWGVENAVFTPACMVSSSVWVFVVSVLL